MEYVGATLLTLFHFRICKDLAAYLVISTIHMQKQTVFIYLVKFYYSLALVFLCPSSAPLYALYPLVTEILKIFDDSFSSTTSTSVAIQKVKLRESSWPNDKGTLSILGTHGMRNDQMISVHS